MSSTLICPILSVRNETIDELCLQSRCALYLPGQKKCSLVFMGYKAMLDIQKIQQSMVPSAPEG